MKISLDHIRRKLNQSEQPFFTFLSHGDLLLELYEPQERDLQTPHSRDEIYIIRQGSGTFEHTGARQEFGAGDVFFVAAGEDHRFVEFSNDFSTWVLFYGPTGGHESPPVGL